MESAAGQRSPDDHAIEGVAPQELADFYRGMSFILGSFLSRVRMEAVSKSPTEQEHDSGIKTFFWYSTDSSKYQVRLGSLAAKNDRQTVLADTDESEQLRR